MGLDLGGLLSSAVSGFSDVFTGNASGIVEDVTQGASDLGFSDQQIAMGAGVLAGNPDVGSDFGYGAEGSYYPDRIVGGGGGSFGGATVMQAGLPLASMAAIPALVRSAIVKLSQTLGGASGSVSGYGLRVFKWLEEFSRRNPGVSLAAMLGSLGLSAAEIAHFLGWGATKRRRRRRRGISSRDFRTTRRTLRRIVRMYHQLPHSSSSRRVTSSRTSIVKA